MFTTMVSGKQDYGYRLFGGYTDRYAANLPQTDVELMGDVDLLQYVYRRGDSEARELINGACNHGIYINDNYYSPASVCEILELDDDY